MMPKPRNKVINKAASGRAIFWKSLPKPFFVLAPMANVTDAVFRTIITKYGKPDVMWTEFVSADGLMSLGQKRLLIDLKFSPKERPIVAQLFTGHPVAMRGAAKLAARLGFDGIDINMGCPDRSVEKQGGGAAMIRNPENALEIIEAARQGIKDAKKNIPVSVKTRIGYNKVDLNSWIRPLLEQGLPALTVHLRTRKEMSDVRAHWELMPEIVKMRDDIHEELKVKGLAPEEPTLIIGNGDVVSLEDAREKCAEYGCDGIMIGRGIFGTPWIFAPLIKSGRNLVTFDKSLINKSPAERLTIMLEHAKLFHKTFCVTTGKKRPIKNFAIMKKHFKAYVSGWDGAKELRVKLMESKDIKEVSKIVKAALAEMGLEK